LSVPLAKLCSFLELHQRLLKLEDLRSIKRDVVFFLKNQPISG
jgi:hypothetical protein